MSIKQEQVSGIQRLIVSGRIDQEQTPLLEEHLNNLLNAGHHTLIVDLADATYINSGGLRCLVSAWRKARQQGGNLILCSLNDRLQEIFSMVGFDKFFSIYPNFKTAVEHVEQ